MARFEPFSIALECENVMSRESCKEIDDWLQRYERDFLSSVPKEIEDDYEKYRRDFLPKRFGAGVGSVVAKAHGEVFFRDLVQVGRGRVTNDKCGKFRGFWGCLQNQKHEGDVDWILKYLNSCDKPSCPTCYYYGWALKEGRAIALRMGEASKLLGLSVEHGVLSLPKSAYDLSFKEAKRLSIEILLGRGVVGGSMIPHRNRVHKRTGVEYFSPHLHCICVLEKEYECRNCARKWNCLKGCGKFDDRNYQSFLDDGWFFKVMGARKTIVGTACYQLNHSSLNPFKARSRVATYFGNCGYNNLRVKVVKPKSLCPLCGSECGFVEPAFSRDIVTDRDSPDFVRVSKEPHFIDGRPAWRVKEVD